MCSYKGHTTINGNYIFFLCGCINIYIYKIVCIGIWHKKPSSRIKTFMTKKKKKIIAANKQKCFKAVLGRNCQQIQQ